MNRFIAHGICYISFFFASSSLAGFAVFMLSGSFQLVEFGFGTAGLLAFDIGISLVFFIQHSGMMRPAFQKKTEHLIPAIYYPAVYSIASGLALIFLLVFWQKSDVMIYAATGPVRWMIRFLFFAVGFGFMWAAEALGAFDPFGIRNIKNRLRGKPCHENPFIVKGPYRLVRHPLYSCMIAMIWLCPDVTADRLLFNGLWTAWIVIGAFLEDRDLAVAFGQPYRRYQETVPMLIPIGFSKKSR